MPVYRNYLMADGSRQEYVGPIYEQRYRTHCLNSSALPGYKEDPTYAPLRNRRRGRHPR